MSETPVDLPVSVKIVAKATVFKRLLLARNNLLSVWSEKDYQAKSISFKIFFRQYYVCNSAELVRQVFLEKHDNYDQKSPQMRHALAPLLGDGLFVSDGKLWKQRRAYCKPAFNIELMPHFATLMTDSALSLVDHWSSLDASKPIDMLDEMARLTAKIIGRTIFGENTPEVDAAQVVNGFTQYQKHVEQLELAESVGLPFLKYLGNPLKRRKTILAARKVQQVIEQIIERRKMSSSDQDFNLLSLLLDGETGSDKPNVCPLGETAARNEAIVMFMAGHETTANSLAWAWYLLDFDPQVMDKLHNELDTVLEGRAPTFADVQNLPYTQAVFEETLRLYPPVPLLSRQAREADQIGNKKIEAGAIILVIPWLLHRHECYWDKPSEFIPERFMPGQIKPNKFIYMPFSVGSRVCIGKRFGLVEGILCLATLAQKYRPRLAPNHTVKIECRLTLRPKGGLPMLIEPR